MWKILTKRRSLWIIIGLIIFALIRQYMSMPPPTTTHLEPALEIAFFSERGYWGPTRNGAIMFMQNDGTQETFFSPSKFTLTLYPLDWAADGRRLLYHSVLNADVAEEYKDTAGLLVWGEAGVEQFIPWAISGVIVPGSSLLFLSTEEEDKRGLQRLALHTGQRKLVLPITEEQNFEEGLRMAWSAHHQEIIFERYEEDPLGWGIYAMREDGTGLRRLRRGRQPAVSPVSPEVVYIRDGSLYLANLAGGDAQPIPISIGKPAWPSWSPDGRQLVFQATVAENTDIYLVNRDGTGLHRLTDFEGFDGVPSWRPTSTQ